jgi:hypothetical protein
LATRIADLRAEVDRIVVRALALVDKRGTQRVAEVEGEVWRLVLSLGRVLMTLFLVRQASGPRAAEYEHDGRLFRIAGTAPKTIGTRFGRVHFERAFGRQVGLLAPARDFPLDRALGLCGGFSMGVVLGIGRLCAQMAFSSARSSFADVYGWSPSTRSTLRIVDALGAQARPFLEACPAPDNDGEVLVVEVDGGGAPMITPTELAHRRRARGRRSETRRQSRRRRKKARAKPRRTKGKKSKNAKVAIVGAIYTLAQTASGKEGPVNKRIYATFESHEALFVWLRREADKRGYGHKRALFLGDGSDHIWRLQELYFPKAETCIDWWHIVEKLWAAGECLYKEGSAELASFIDTQIRRLRGDDVDLLIDDLRSALDGIPRTGPGNKGRRQRLEDIINHLAKNSHRMPYRRFRRSGLPIASGVIEGAVRHLVRVRLDGPGMRWSRQRAELVLHLRCVLLNGQWDQFAAHVARIPQLRLSAQPVPCEPHLAKAAA